MGIEPGREQPYGQGDVERGDKETSGKAKGVPKPFFLPQCYMTLDVTAPCNIHHQLIITLYFCFEWKLPYNECCLLQEGSVKDRYSNHNTEANRDSKVP